MKTFYITFVAGVLLIFFTQSTFGATPGEVYAKHSKKIIQGDINVFAGNVFFTVHSEVKKRLSDNLIFRKLKTKALNEIRSGYQHYKFPGENKLWFELYYSLPSISKFSIKNSFVVDKQIKENQAYLVLTAPEHQLSSTKINLKKIKDTVNIAFDNGSLISLIKYSRLVSGDRLKEVKKEIALRANIKLSQKTNVDIESTKENNGNSKPDNLNKKPKLLTNKIQNEDIYEDSNIDTQIGQTDDASNNSKEKLIDEDKIRKPIDCALPLCDEINSKRLKRNSSEETKSKNQIKKPSNDTTITIDNELDDLL
jgi:hypothetical protein